MTKDKMCRKKWESKDGHLLENLKKKADGRQEGDIDNVKG